MLTCIIGSFMQDLIHELLPSSEVVGEASTKYSGVLCSLVELWDLLGCIFLCHQRPQVVPSHCIVVVQIASPISSLWMVVPGKKDCDDKF